MLIILPGEMLDTNQDVNYYIGGMLETNQDANYSTGDILEATQDANYFTGEILETTQYLITPPKECCWKLLRI